jgi:hypothetical protein
MHERMIIVLVLKGRYNTATVYTDKIEPEAEAQIIELLNQDFIQAYTFMNIHELYLRSGWQHDLHLPNVQIA